jgi:hypothetical protein
MIFQVNVNKLPAQKLLKWTKKLAIDTRNNNLLQDWERPTSPSNFWKLILSCTPAGTVLRHTGPATGHIVVTWGRHSGHLREGKAGLLRFCCWSAEGKGPKQQVFTTQRFSFLWPAFTDGRAKVRRHMTIAIGHRKREKTQKHQSQITECSWVTSSFLIWLIELPDVVIWQNT